MRDGTAASYYQAGVVFGTANRARREAAAAEHSGCSGTCTSPAAEKQAPPGRTGVRSTARDQSRSSPSASSCGGRGGGRSGFSFRAALGVERKQDAAQAAAAAAGVWRAATPSLSDVTNARQMMMECVQRPLKRPPSQVSSEGQQASSSGSNDSDSTGAGPCVSKGSSSSGSSSSGIGSGAQPAAVSVPSSAEAQPTQVSSRIVLEVKRRPAHHLECSLCSSTNVKSAEVVPMHGCLSPCCAWSSIQCCVWCSSSMCIMLQHVHSQALIHGAKP